MKKGKIAIAAVITAMTAISIVKAEITTKLMPDSPQYIGINPANTPGHSLLTDGQAATFENLTGTTEKISSVNMEKNFSEAGNILAGFYSGSKAKGDSAPTVYAESRPPHNSVAKTEKDICNAKPSKIVLSGKVPALEQAGTKSTKQEKSGLPIASAGIFAAGALALGLVGRKSGYFSNYAEDAQTVWDYVTGGDSNSENDSPNTSNSGNSIPAHTVVNVDNSSGTVVTSTGTDNSCPSSSTACNGEAWLGSQLDPY